MSSTERLAPRAFPIGRLPQAVLVEMGRRLGISGHAPGALGRAIGARLGDRQAVAARLARLSGLALVLLEALAESGGVMAVDAALALVRARTACGEPAFAAAVDEAVVGAFLVLLELDVARSTRGRPSRDPRMLGLIDPSAEHVAALVRGVTLPPPEPPAGARACPPAGAERDRIALSGLTAHRPLKFTSSFGAHGAQLKRFGKNLGLELEPVRERVESAAREDLLGARGDHFAPRVAQLLAHAGTIDDWLDAWLPPDGWTSVEAIARATALRAQHGGGNWAPGPDAVQSALRDATDRVRGARGVEVVEAEGSAWVRRRVASPDEPVDGHVTPSFDVLLGPTPDLRLVAIVALGCELVRINRVLTFRLTPASVQAGLAVGLSPSDLTACLARIGKHGVPGNVAAMLADWLARHRPARLAKVWMIVVPSAIADELGAGELRNHIVDRPAPNVLALDADVPRAKLVALLDQKGISAGDVVSLSEAMRERYDSKYGLSTRDYDEDDGEDYYDDDDHDDFELPSLSPRRRRGEQGRPSLPLRFQGDPALAQRVEDARRAGFPPPGHVAPFPRESAEDGGAPLERDVRRAAETLRGLHGQLQAELERWANRLAPTERARAAPLVRRPAAIAPLLIASRKARQRVLESAACLEQLIVLVTAEIARGGLSPSGQLVLPWLAEAAELLDGETQGGAAPPAPADPAPVPGPVPQKNQAAVRAALENACAASAVVRLAVRSGGGSSVHRVTAVSLQPRGASAALLAVDPDTDEGRVFALGDVLGVEPDATDGPRGASV